MSAPVFPNGVDVAGELVKLTDAVNAACDAAIQIGVPPHLMACAVGAVAARRAFERSGLEGLHYFLSVVGKSAIDESLWEDEADHRRGVAGMVVQ